VTSDALLEKAEGHRRELLLHCYRMVGNVEEAEDHVQETFLRAWRARTTFDQSNLRAWLYRIATNVCLDALRKSPRQVDSLESLADLPWLQPFPDRLLADDEPGAAVIAKETIELAYIALIQLLPPRQRAVLILRDVLGWSASEAAATLETTAPSVNSALQRARATIGGLAPARDDAAIRSWQPSEWERQLLDGYISAHEGGDINRMIALMHEDIRITMPPVLECYDGRESLLRLLERAFASEGMGEWLLRPVWANHQPATVSYLRPSGEANFRAYKIDVLTVVGRKVREITTFGTALTAHFGVPELLPRA
jgi:RNA polymerase sigma-70 factor (TIGR02960 family)